MSVIEVITYGDGGYDSSKPNNNVVSTETITLDATTVNSNTLRDKADTALTNNIAALALPAPSFPLSNAAQQALVNQVTALTRQNNAIIRLLLDAFDSTAGT